MESFWPTAGIEKAPRAIPNPSAIRVYLVDIVEISSLSKRRFFENQEGEGPDAKHTIPDVREVRVLLTSVRPTTKSRGLPGCRCRAGRSTTHRSSKGSATGCVPRWPD